MLQFDHQRARFLDREGKVARTDLLKHGTTPQATEVDWRVRPRRRDHPGTCWEVLDQVADRVGARLVRERMQVVQDDRDRAVVAGQRICQLVHCGLQVGSRHPKPLQRVSPKPRPDPVDCRRNIRPQAGGIVVAGIQRHPGDGRFGLSRGPRLDEDRLSKPNRRRDQRQRRRAESVEHAQQPSANENLRPHARWGEFRLGQRQRFHDKRLKS